MTISKNMDTSVENLKYFTLGQSILNFDQVNNNTFVYICVYFQ